MAITFRQRSPEAAPDVPEQNLQHLVEPYSSSG